MNLRRIYFTLFILLILVVLLKYNLVYQIVKGSIDFTRWKKNILLTDSYHYQILKSKNQAVSLVDYYETIPNNTMSVDVTALFDAEILDKTYQEDYLNPKILGKTDSLPDKVGYFTTPHNILGPIQGESIFRFDYESRGKNNKQKEEYMKALRKEDLMKYQQVIRNYLEKDAQLINQKYNMEFKCHRICIDLFYLLHFSLMPLPQDYEDVHIFLDAVVQFPFVDVNHISSLRQINNLKSFYHRSLKRSEKLKKNKKHCLVYRWLQTDLTEGDIFIELIHNILAMVSNWFNTLYPYLLNVSLGKIPKLDTTMDTRTYLQECFRYITPVRYASSKIKNPREFKKKLPDKSYTTVIKDKITDEGNYMHLYDLKSQTHNSKWWGENANEFNLNRYPDLEEQLKNTLNTPGKCPFLNTIRNAKVDRKLPIYEKKGYLPFGDGYRRCPGEYLSMIFLEEIARLIADKEVDIILLDGESKPARYIWGVIETNFQLWIH